MSEDREIRTAITLGCIVLAAVFAGAIALATHGSLWGNNVCTERTAFEVGDKTLGASGTYLRRFDCREKQK